MPHSITRRQWMLGALSAGALGRSLSAAPQDRIPAPGARPNVVLILSDDQGYGDLGCYGGAHLKTPRIDALAAKGVRFTRYYANAPECTPTRTALMTGRYQQRVGGLECAIGVGNVGRYDEAEWLQGRGELGLPVEESTLALSLKKAGYATACIGKWHLGYGPQFAPRKHGFDEYWGPLGGTVDYFHYREPTGEAMLYRNESPVKATGYLTDLIAEESVKWLEKQRGPYFLYVPFTAPHTPYQSQDDSAAEATEANWNKGTRATYARMVNRLDEAVGSILDAVERRGDARNTFVIFVSDNGATRMGENGILRGFKSQLFEGGIRVPCLMRWPGVLPENREASFPAMTVDISATVLAACGATPLRKTDGIDLTPYLRANTAPKERELFFRYKRLKARRKAMIVGDWKYIQDGTDEFVFNLASDPSESQNLLASGSLRADRMRTRIAAWEREVQAPRLKAYVAP